MSPRRCTFARRSPQLRQEGDDAMTTTALARLIRRRTSQAPITTPEPPREPEARRRILAEIAAEEARSATRASRLAEDIAAARAKEAWAHEELDAAVEVRARLE